MDHNQAYQNRETQHTVTKALTTLSSDRWQQLDMAATLVELSAGQEEKLAAARRLGRERRIANVPYHILSRYADWLRGNPDGVFARFLEDADIEVLMATS